MSTLLQQKCPCCGGAVEFDTGAQKLKCPYCDTEFDIDALNKTADLPDTDEESINWEKDNAQWEEGETENMVVYTCNSCGGEIVTDSTTGATACPFCGNPTVMTGHFSGDLKPDVVIPFKLDKKAAKEMYLRFISKKKLLPKVFKEQNHIDEIKGIYVPHWLFSGRADASADFSAKKVRHWADSNYNYTETKNYSIHRSGNMNFSYVPVDGSSKMDDTLMESIEPFHVDEYGVPFNPSYLAGFYADKYDVDLEASIPRANERIKNSAIEGLRGTIDAGYTTVSKINSNVNVASGSYKYALYPVWILNTTWQDKKYIFAMNGQTGKFVGDLPLDKKAFAKWTAIVGAGLSVLTYAAVWAWFTFM